MGEEKKTVMVLKVDLGCYSCYKKVKKTLCRFPQIRDQVFDEKANTVTIVVMCCSPEKIRDKLCYKAGKAIKSIDIKKDDSSPPKEPEKPKVLAEKPKEPEKPKVAEKPKELEKPKVVVEKPKEPEKPKVVAEKPKAPEKPKEPEKPKVVFIEPEKPKTNGKVDKPKSDDKPVEKPPKADPPPKQPEQAPKPANPAPEAGIIKTSDPVNGYPLQVYPQAFPLASYCGQCYDGYGGGPCYHTHGFGAPAPPPPGPYYDGYGHGYGYGGNSVGYVTRYEHLNEENPSGCSIM